MDYPENSLPAVLGLLVIITLSLTIPACHSLGKDPGIDGLRERMGTRRKEGVLRARARIGELASFLDIPNLDAAARGGIPVASAAWWLDGNATPDAKSSTAALRAALSAPVDVLVIPALPVPWLIDGTLELLDGPREIILEPGCVIAAAAGAFKETNASLIKIGTGRTRLISGYGATLSMRGDDYRSKDYAPSQWRHGLELRSVAGLVVEGLEIRDTGGDGVYVGEGKNKMPCSGLVLRDLILEANHRQGISVISANGFLMEYCRVAGTKGTPPQAGIDFEPNAGTWGFERCVIGSSVFERNKGAAMHVHLVKLSADRKVDIVVRDSVLVGSPLALWIRGVPKGLTGTIDIGETQVRGLVTIKQTSTFSVRRER